MSFITGVVSKHIKNGDDIKNPQVRASYGKCCNLMGIFCNILLFFGKLAAGLISKSVSITADAVNNLSDASSNIISLMGFKLASRPADREHPYGHGRYEYLSALMVAVIIMVIGVELFKTSVDKIINPHEVETGVLTFVILGISIAVKLFMMFFNREIGKLIDSGSLLATSADSRNDVIATSAVAASAIISELCHVELDGYMGVAVAIFILISGFSMIRDTVDPLLGTAPSPELVQHIHDKILSYDGVLGTHDLIVHDYGPGKRFASVHVEVSAEEDVLRTHDILDNIEKDFLENDGLHLVAHLDPVTASDSRICEIRALLCEIINEFSSDLSIHDLRVVDGATHTNIIFDCVVPYNIKLTEKEIKSEIARRVKSVCPTYNCVITVDRPFVAISH
ncbi:MAG: cation transporter [Clostridia bacterium]|nr:cation transporter [Clostridia bacterium]